jgi:hypothetical protein
MKISSLFNWFSAPNNNGNETAETERVNIVNLDDLEKGLVESSKNNENYYGAMERQMTAPICGDDHSGCAGSHTDNSNVHVHHLTFLDNHHDCASLVESVFSTVRSVEKEEEMEETNESEFYRHSSAFQRAMPERLFALTMTLILEIPVLMMVSGGSDALCGLIGRSRYQLLIGFLPLTSAISGNVGLQASTLTTRAISHSHVTMKDYWLWLSTEISAAAYLGLGMGGMLGSIAFVASRFDVAFGITICVAQLLSIVTAGVTGTLAPLLFSFIFKRDSGKWGGPLETAIQDIVGSFAMVIVSYHILRLLGPGPVDPSDYCGPVMN